MPEYKRGALNKDEKSYIEKFRLKKTTEEIALDLGRSPSIVERHLLEQGGHDPNGGLIERLRSRPEWANFQLQFSAEELDLFVYHYLRLMRQLGEDDIIPTEEMQVFDLIKAEIQLGRNLREQKKIADDMQEVTSQLDEAKRARPSKGKSAMDSRAEIRNLEIAYKDLSTSLKDVIARQNTIETSKKVILKDLKGTREQRVKVVENSRTNFPALLKMLMQEDMTRKNDEQIRMMNLAVEKERARLSAPHRYADGVVDQPVLTSETLVDDYTPCSPPEAP
jgi:translation initiation factor 2 beta subunit (eIF-2beta)/eIF-5